MTNNTLIKTLSRLDKKKLTRFREFAASPYFNKHKEVIALITYLSTVYPNFTEKKCSRHFIFKQVFPKSPFEQKKLAIVFTYATRLMEQFFRVEEARFQEKSLEDNSLLLRHLRRYNLNGFLQKKWKGNIGGVNETLPKPSSTRELEKQMKQAAENDACAVHLSDYSFNFLEEKQALLDVYYLTEKLKDACELVQRSNYLKQRFEPTPLLVSALEVAQKQEAYLRRYWLPGIYSNLYKLLKNNDLEQYPRIKKEVEKHAADLSDTELQYIYNALQNFCIQQINQAEPGFLRQLFDIYILQLERNLLLVGGYLPEWHFKNIVTTGLRLKEHAWVKDFIEKSRPVLHPGIAENAFGYNLANYYYHTKNYGEVLRLLVEVEYTDLRYNLDAKSLLLRTYFDLGEEEALMALTDAFRQFLKRNKALKEFKKMGYYNLIKFSRRAFRLKMQRHFTKQKKWENDLKKLREKVDAAETIFNREWLLERLTMIND
ncbi:MAG TPA: hypothetical protein ENJ95_00225 [Bacteroidetes bacterium]|nr:hypothetical protein [Bacteroidota bacterium]